MYPWPRYQVSMSLSLAMAPRQESVWPRFGTSISNDPLLVVGPVICGLLFLRAAFERRLSAETPLSKLIVALMVVMTLEVFNPLQGGLTVGIASSLGNGLSASSVVTDATGNGTVTYTATNAGTDTLTFTGGGTSVAAQLIVSAANFSFTSPNANTQVAVGASQAVTVTYLVNGAAQANQTINFTSTPPAAPLQGSTYNVSATATSGLPVTIC